MLCEFFAVVGGDCLHRMANETFESPRHRFANLRSRLILDDPRCRQSGLTFRDGDKVPTLPGAFLGIVFPLPALRALICSDGRSVIGVQLRMRPRNPLIRSVFYCVRRIAEARTKGAPARPAFESMPRLTHAGLASCNRPDDRLLGDQ